MRCDGLLCEKSCDRCSCCLQFAHSAACTRMLGLYSPAMRSIRIDRRQRLQSFARASDGCQDSYARRARVRPVDLPEVVADAHQIGAAKPMCVRATTIHRRDRGTTRYWIADPTLMAEFTIRCRHLCRLTDAPDNRLISRETEPTPLQFCALELRHMSAVTGSWFVQFPYTLDAVNPRYPLALRTKRSAIPTRTPAANAHVAAIVQGLMLIRTACR